MNVNFSSSQGTVVINGESFSGNNVCVKNGEVYIDGKKADSSNFINDKVYKVEIHGDVDKFDLASGTVVAQNVNKLKTISADVECGDVKGDVETVSGDVKAKVIHGDVETVSGNIKR